ncbi:MAG: glycoside hydrolase family 28 protein [bacterium]
MINELFKIRGNQFYPRSSLFYSGRNLLVKKLILFTLLILFPVAIYSQKKCSNDFSKYLDNLPFVMGKISVPEFPDKDFCITDFGAIGDGQTLNTTAFEKAISTCVENGGGRVVIPRGIWLTGPIWLKSNVNLHLEIGSHIQFTENKDAYPVIESYFEGVPQFRCASPINGRNLVNVAITGDGIIDGNGDYWRYLKKDKVTEDFWNQLVKSGGVVAPDYGGWWPSQQALDGVKRLPELLKDDKLYTKENFEMIRDHLRPVLISLIECKNVLLDGPTFQNSPAWNIHPLKCSNLIVRNINVRNPWYSQNGDGIDVESCKDVLIYNCKFDVGDDAICMKSGKGEYGRKRGIPTENVVIADCIVYHGHGGFTVGSEMSGGVRNVKLSNLNFIGTDVGLRFKSTRGRGGIVENIFIEDIFMKDIPTDAIHFNLFYGGFAPKENESELEQIKNAKEEEVNDGTPQFKNIKMKNIYCSGAAIAFDVRGLPEMPVQGIELENVVIKSRKGISIYYGTGIKIVGSKILCSESPAINIIHGKDILIEQFEYADDANPVIKVDGMKTKNIVLKGLKKEVENKIEFGKDVNENVIIIE